MNDVHADSRDAPSTAFVDPAGQLAFLEQMYLARGGFVAQGGANLKFVRGRIGAGKTRFLQELVTRAGSLGYLAISIDAATSDIKRIDDLYRQLLAPVDVWAVVRRFATQVISHLGADPDRIPAGTSYVDWLVQQGRVPETVRHEASKALETGLFHNAHLKRSFCFALLYMTGHVLGVRTLAPEARRTLENWIKGLPVPARDRNSLNVREAIDRYNARLMLRSWLTFVRLSGYRGLVATLDSMDVLLNTNPAVGPKYTKMRRDDLYETIRELIDEMDSLEGLLVVMAARDELFTDAKAGLHSYPALWMRIQNEAEPEPGSRQVNRFADIIDLDRVWESVAPDGFIDLALGTYRGIDGDGGPASAPDARTDDIEPEVVAAVRRVVQQVLDSRDLSVSPVLRIVRSVEGLRRELQR